MASPLSVFAKVSSAIKQWLSKRLNRSGQASPDTAGLGTVNPSKNRRFKWLQKLKLGWGDKRRPRGVWCPGLEIAQVWLENVEGKMLSEGAAMLEEEANRLAEMVRQAIYHQQYRWKPLSQRYLKWKERKGRDTRIYLATHEYVQSIQVTPTPDDEEVAFVVGLPDKIHVDSGLPLRKLAAIHEFGSRKRNIPARPLWRPTWERWRREVKAKVNKRLKEIAEEESAKLQEDMKKAMPGVTVTVRTT